MSQTTILDVWNTNSYEEYTRAKEVQIRDHAGTYRSSSWVRRRSDSIRITKYRTCTGLTTIWEQIIYSFYVYLHFKLNRSDTGHVRAKKNNKKTETQSSQTAGERLRSTNFRYKKKKVKENICTQKAARCTALQTTWIRKLPVFFQHVSLESNKNANESKENKRHQQ